MHYVAWAYQTMWTGSADFKFRPKTHAFNMGAYWEYWGGISAVYQSAKPTVKVYKC